MKAFARTWYHIWRGAVRSNDSPSRTPSLFYISPFTTGKPNSSSPRQEGSFTLPFFFKWSSTRRKSFTAWPPCDFPRIPRSASCFRGRKVAPFNRICVFLSRLLVLPHKIVHALVKNGQPRGPSPPSLLNRLSGPLQPLSGFERLGE